MQKQIRKLTYVDMMQEERLQFLLRLHMERMLILQIFIQKVSQRLQIQLKPEVADGKYSNLAMIGHGPNEFLIDFIFAAPGMPQAPVVSRIVMSPENAKQLMYALTDNIKKYEANFGEITQKRPVGGNNMPPFGNFGGNN